jgi:hypothetical protein
VPSGARASTGPTRSRVSFNPLSPAAIVSAAIVSTVMAGLDPAIRRVALNHRAAAQFAERDHHMLATGGTLLQPLVPCRHVQ